MSKDGEVNSFKFGSPEDYEHMTKEERDKLTQKMMNKHKIWKNSIGRKDLGG